MIKGIVVHEQEAGVSLNDFQEFALGLRQALSSITSKVVTVEQRTLAYTNDTKNGNTQTITLPGITDLRKIVVSLFQECHWVQMVLTFG